MEITDFKSFVRTIENNQCVLPDFQREFVWEDEEMQTKLIASVLAKLPIGTILLLKSSPKEFYCKKIGTKIELPVNEEQNEVNFLLDGQQRVTVLTNVFSDVIYRTAKSVSNFTSPKALKRRFFICIPRWDRIKESIFTSDIFGVKKLKFPYKDPKNDIPKFLSNEIQSYIKCIPYNASDDVAYNPKNIPSNALSTYCIGYEEGMLIPLYLMADGSDNSNRYFKNIIINIGNNIKEQINDFFLNLSDEQKQEFIEDFLCEQNPEEDVVKAKQDTEIFIEYLNNRADSWSTNIQDYLESCLEKMQLSQIELKNSERSRAIDIYENMNIGGVKLNTFDLITARVASVDRINYRSRIIEKMKQQRTYKTDLMPETTKKIFVEKLSSYSYNASIYTDCLNKDEKLTPLYEDIFLDTLSLYSCNEGYDEKIYDISLTKRSTVLDLKANIISQNTDKIIEAIDRAMFFFQSRCGIRTISEINYTLIVVIVAVIFTNDDWYSNITNHEIIEAWYWATIFGGTFDKDQNAAMIRDLISLIKTIKKDKSNDWIKIINNDNVFNSKYYSDKDTLLMKRKDEERFPKTWLSLAISQFFLSRTYPDLLDKEKILSPFYEKNESNFEPLEKHHIIPLGTSTSYKESTESLRKDPTNLLNSPINFALITKFSNNKISDDDINTYLGKVCPEAKAALKLNLMTALNPTDSTSLNALDKRFDDIAGEVKLRIGNLL